jgi:NAD(P)-dependent dehydrogenase (short-subunit alcohol dehydrogenase family)
VELGTTLAVLDLDKASCESCVKHLSRIRPDSAFSLPCDLNDLEETRAAVNQVIWRFGRLDIVVHCAAYTGETNLSGWAVPFERQTVSAWEAGLRVNLTSAFVIVQAAREALAASGHGSVILIGSIYGMVGPDARLYADTSMENPAAYGASKGGLLELGRYLATTLAPAVRVNVLSPGGVLRNQPEVFRKRYEYRTPLARMATEEDIKGAVAFLAGDLSAYVTGHNLVVDGGWTVW